MQKDTKDLFAARKIALQHFHDWQKKQPLEMSIQTALEGLDFLYQLLPEASRQRPMDPSGIMLMRRALAHLKGERQ
ncbi:MAG: hypothetical protein JXO51_11345 [Candidatus Aminicenantes bacterium]|nr:hypothetical protein [Candidatus Aminicenantes bacterium]